MYAPVHLETVRIRSSDVIRTPSAWVRTGITKDSQSSFFIEVVEGFPLALWILRHGQNYLKFNNEFANPQEELFRSYAKLFQKGIGECRREEKSDTILKSLAQTYDASQLVSPGFVTSEVNLIFDPANINGTWDQGLFFNFTVYFIPGKLANREDAWTELLRFVAQKRTAKQALMHRITEENRYELGTTDLFRSPFQINPFGPCWNNDCDKFALCIVLSKTTYTCKVAFVVAGT